MRSSCLRGGPTFLLGAALLALTSACGGGEESAPPVDDSVAKLCVDTINEHRASMKLPAYDRWTDAESCANSEAKKDGEGGGAHGAFGECGELAQNECPDWNGPLEGMIVKCLQQMWDEGPGEDFGAHGHFINMSSAKYKKVACGFFTLEGGKIWSVQDFK